MSRNKYLKILELSDSASSEEIERAYKELVRVWHPDRFQSDEILRVKAEEKTRELNLAYSELKKFNKQTESSSTELEEHFQAFKKETSSKSFNFVRPILAAGLICLAGSYFNIWDSILNLKNKNIRIGQNDFFSLKESRSQSGKYRSIREEKQDDMTRLEVGTTTIKPPFLKAAVDCLTDDVRKMLGQGHNLEEHDAGGHTALIWASRQGCDETVNLLISRGADVNKKSTNGFSPLMWATLYRRDKVMKALLAAGSEPLPKFWDKAK